MKEYLEKQADDSYKLVMRGIVSNRQPGQEFHEDRLFGTGSIIGGVRDAN